MEDAVGFHGFTGISPSGFYHASRVPIGRVNDRPQPPWPSFKPRGFWYDVGGAWVEWMRIEMPSWYDESRFLYSVSLSPAARILRIRGSRGLERFVGKYAATHPSMGKFPVPDWAAVAREWDGIEFSPYRHELRAEHIWYSMVDVPSGCVWNPGAVSLELVAHR